MVARLALIACVLGAAGACTTARAAKPVERPALEVPPPPPRVIAPLPLPNLPQVDLVPELPTNNNATSPRSKAKSERPEPQKPDPKPDTPPVAEAPPPSTPAQPASPVLRMPEGADNTQLQNQVKTQIATTRAILEKTDYGPLKPPLKNAYDQARNFVVEAEAALKSGNLVYAKEVAEKAERLAKELQNR
jgi:hypothetical protein